jgi:hypothetical protein
MNMTHKLHTPGPWRVEPTPSADRYICADKPEGQAELAKVYDSASFASSASTEHGGALPAEANARLIAAAPDLLAAARRVAHNPSNQHAMDALAKAIHDAAGSLYCEHCEGSGYVHDYDESTPCTHCLDGREVAEQEARNA